MQPDAEARVRVAVAELAEALIDLARTAAPTATAGPVELYSPARCPSIIKVTGINAP